MWLQSWLISRYKKCFSFFVHHFLFFQEYSADCDPPFPEELKGEDFKHGLALVSEDPCTRWYKPTNLEELEKIVREMNGRKIKFIAGGTGKFKHPHESDEGVEAFVQVTGVKGKKIKF